MKYSKCAIQNGRPDRYWKLKRMMKKRKKTPHTPHPDRDRTPRRRSIPEIAVWCHLPWKTSQLPAEPENGPEDEETQKFANSHIAGQRLADTDA